ncbi:hypothetical protein ACIPPS_03210 [Streptomyces sp. NPDC090127]|uniref:hypothetical protein n=1 Tax=Streptomyces sp. NPDC090127 TaxID=3365953 RepID=UPI00382ECD14
MPTETTGRTPHDLAAELTAELAVDWPRLWRGLPQLGGPEFRTLFESCGWEYEVPVHERGAVSVRTPTDAHLTVFMDGRHRVEVARHYACQVMADDPAENAAVLARAAQDWPDHLKAVESVLGPPTWTGPWDAADFPEPPHPSYWPDGAYRLENRSPEALAYWEPAGGAEGRPWVLLEQSVSRPTRTTTRPGSFLVTLDLWAPPESLNAANVRGTS